MKKFEEKILKEGKVLKGNILKVDGFLNHRIDVEFLNEVGKEFKRLYKDTKIDKIMTIEASGIGIACIVAQYFKVPVVFAKKTLSKNIGDDLLTAKVYSFTKDVTYDIVVNKNYINKDENVLIIDDFLAKGGALLGLIDIINQAGAKVAGCGICIEKAFQEGGELVRSKGYRVESLARVAKMDDQNIYFVED